MKSNHIKLNNKATRHNKNKGPVGNPKQDIVPETQESSLKAFGKTKEPFYIQLELLKRS